jgi:hypothetical protein
VKTIFLHLNSVHEAKLRGMAYMATCRVRGVRGSGAVVCYGHGNTKEEAVFSLLKNPLVPVKIKEGK